MPVLTDTHSFTRPLALAAFNNTAINITVKIGKYTGSSTGALDPYLEEDVDWLVEFPLENTWEILRSGNLDVCNNFGSNYVFNTGLYREDLLDEITVDTAGIFLDGELVKSFLPNNKGVILGGGLGSTGEPYIYREEDVIILSNIYMSASLGTKTRLTHGSVGLVHCVDTFFGKRFYNVLGAEDPNPGDGGENTFRIVCLNNNYEEVWSHELGEMVVYEPPTLGDILYITNSEKETLEYPTLPAGPAGTAAYYMFCGDLFMYHIKSFAYGGASTTKTGIKTSLSCSQHEIFLPGRITASLICSGGFL